MSRNYKFRDQKKQYFISFATVNWIDVFVRSEYKDILVASINYCIENKGLIVYGWVIMSNHVHMIIGTKQNDMQDIIRDLKKYTSKELLKLISENHSESRREWMMFMFEKAGKKNSNNTRYQFWQQNNHPIELYNNKILEQKLNYIHNNPIKKGYVLEPYEYKYSSAIDYVGGKGLVNIVLASTISYKKSQVTLR